MLLSGIFSVFLAVLALIFGAFVYARNTNSRVNRAFMYFSALSSVWILSSSFGGNVSQPELSRWLVITDFASGMLVAIFFLVFAARFKNYNDTPFIVISSVITSVLLLIYFTDPSLLLEITADNTGDTLVSEGPLFFPIFAFPLLLVIIAGLYVLFKRETANETEIHDFEGRRVVKKSLFVAAILTMPNVFSGSIFKSDFAITLLQQLASLGVVVFLVGVGLAVVRYKLFDVRIIVARALGYALTLGLLVLLYIVVSFTVLRSLLEINLSGIDQVILFCIVIFIAMTLRIWSSLVERLIQGTFYRDSYDTQKEIDRLATLAVSEYQIDELVSRSLRHLSDAIKPTTGKFILLDAHGDYYNDYRIEHSPRLGALKAIDILSSQKELVFLTDEYEAEYDQNITHSKKDELYNYLRDHDVSMSVRLSTQDEVVGYILFGPKLTGNIYSRQDYEFMSIAANELSIAIQNARRFDEIQQFNETLKLEVERSTGELRASNEKLQALDVAKDEFITMASHQLRTPLTSVKGYLSMVLEGDTGKISKKQRDLLGAAFSSSQRMVYLIGDLLNVSRLQTGKFVIEPTVVDLPELIKSEIEQLAETAKSKKLKLKFHEPKKFPELYMDETKTRQVIMNFIDNAIYYTPQGGQIDVSLEATKAKIEFTVVDNGIGVPKSEAHNLFTKFYRAGNARKARPDGTGLGLFMAKKVIIDQGGAVVFHSKEGKGSTFGFTFPITRVRPPKKSSQ